MFRYLVYPLHSCKYCPPVHNLVIIVQQIGKYLELLMSQSCNIGLCPVMIYRSATESHQCLLLMITIVNDNRFLPGVPCQSIMFQDAAKEGFRRLQEGNEEGQRGVREQKGGDFGRRLALFLSLQIRANQRY